jgi:hypothetical protein
MAIALRGKGAESCVRVEWRSAGLLTADGKRGKAWVPSDRMDDGRLTICRYRRLNTDLLTRRDVKNEDRSDYVYENTRNSDTLSR